MEEILSLMLCLAVRILLHIDIYIYLITTKSLELSDVQSLFATEKFRLPFGVESSVQSLFRLILKKITLEHAYKFMSFKRFLPIFFFFIVLRSVCSIQFTSESIVIFAFQ